MPSPTAEYKTRVLDEVNSYRGLCHPVRANFFERLLTRNVRIQDLHPNPDDEFCIESIGPNYSIVQEYERHIRVAMGAGAFAEPIEDALIVEKMSTGGFMLLNGHHRWLAAIRAGLSRVPVQIINTVPDTKIISKVEKSRHDMVASFDLDEVLLAGDSEPSGKDLPFPLNKIFPQRVRKNTGALVKELRKMGFAIWIYTGDYHDNTYLKTMLALHGIRVDGIVSGLKRKKSGSTLRQAFSKKYCVSVHVDNESVLMVNTRSMDYVTETLPKKAFWAVETLACVKKSLSELNKSGAES